MSAATRTASRSCKRSSFRSAVAWPTAQEKGSTVIPVTHENIASMRWFAKALGWQVRHRRACPKHPDGLWTVITHTGARSFVTFERAYQEVGVPIIGAWITDRLADHVAMAMDDPAHPHHRAAWAWAQSDERWRSVPMQNLAYPAIDALIRDFPRMWTEDDVRRLVADFEISGRLLRAIDRKRAARSAAGLTHAVSSIGPGSPRRVRL